MTRNHICKDCGDRFPCAPDTPGHYYNFARHWTICDSCTETRKTGDVLLAHLSTNPLHIDDLRRAAQLPIAQVCSALAILELRGYVRQTQPLQYISTEGFDA